MNRMSTSFRYFVLFLSFFLLLPRIALAQEEAEKQAPQPYKAYQPQLQYWGPLGKSTTASPLYNHAAREALERRPADFDFNAFRINYADTEQYDPLSEETRDKLLTLAYTIQNEKDNAKRAQALDAYGALLAAHLGNFDIVTQALVLSRQDRRFGDPSFFEWMRKGLLQSVLQSGDGGNLFRAYDVYVMGEEAALLNTLNMQVITTDMRESGGTYYNMHEVYDGKLPKPYTLFVDITRPMAWLEQQKKEKGVNFAIGRQ